MPSICGAAVLFVLLGCAPQAPSDPTADDPALWPLEDGSDRSPAVSAPTWLIPARVPEDFGSLLASNNNVAVASWNGDFYLLWRNAPTHFASPQARLHLMRSSDGGERWVREVTFALDADVREPWFTTVGGTLVCGWFEAGSNPLAFEPRQQWRSVRDDATGVWSTPEAWGTPGEITWSVKQRGGWAYRTSYRGAHYSVDEPSALAVWFTRSRNGLDWEPVEGDGVVYRGGVSEVDFEFDEVGDLWAVTRNEDGDATGFGSHVCTAPRAHLGTWDCGTRARPERYDSPRMFRHQRSLYLLARRDIGGPTAFIPGDVSPEERWRYLVGYSSRPKRTGLYRIDRLARKVEHLEDLPSRGDTAFPAVLRRGAHHFTVFNYTSPLDAPGTVSWLDGQQSPQGTAIYSVDLTFP